MRDNDQRILEERYTKVVPQRFLAEQTNGNVFSADIKIDIYGENTPDDFVFDDGKLKAKLTYKMKVNLMPWGIDGIDIELIKLDSFVVETTLWSEEADEYIKKQYKIGEIDLSGVKPEFNQAKDEYGDKKKDFLIAPSYIDLGLRRTIPFSERNMRWLPTHKEVYFTY
jgi:hypothetical protein